MNRYNHLSLQDTVRMIHAELIEHFQSSGVCSDSLALYNVVLIHNLEEKFSVSYEFLRKSKPLNPKEEWNQSNMSFVRL